MAKKQEQEQAPARTQLAPSRMPIIGALAKEFDVTADQWRVLVDQIFPNAKTVEAIGMALSYCRARDLDIYKRPVHIVPMWSAALGRMVETVWPGIAEIRTTAHRTGNYAGIDKPVFGPMITRTFKDKIDVWGDGRKTGAEQIEATVEFPEFVETTVYRMVEGKKRAFTAIVFWEEAYASVGKTIVPNSMWQKRRRSQPAKCAEAAALRMAFPEELGNTYVAEEMEGRTIEGAVTAPVAEITAKPALPALPEFDEPPRGGPPAPVANASPKDAGEAEQSGAGSAGDFNGDDSEFVPPTPDEKLNNLRIWLEQATTADGIEDVWSELDIESEFTNDEERLGKAVDMYVEHMARVNKPSQRTDEEQAALDKQIDDLFPGARGS